MLADTSPPFFDPDALPRVVSRAEAVRRGYSARAIHRHVEAGRWQRVLPRTFVTGSAITERDRADAALSFAGHGAALSGAYSLRASGVRGVALPARCLVLVPPSNRTGSIGYVDVRCTARPFALEHWAGPRRVQPARAAADLALSMRRIDDVRALVARVVQDGHATLPELGAELAAGPTQGSAFLRQALREVGWGARSAPEARAAKILRSGRVPLFEQNAQIDLPHGGYYVADFLWRGLRAVLEIDSVEYHFSREEWASTMDRHLALSQLGFSVIHRPPSALKDEARFRDDVVRWLRGREADLRRSLR